MQDSHWLSNNAIYYDPESKIKLIFSNEGERSFKIMIGIYSSDFLISKNFVGKSTFSISQWQRHVKKAKRSTKVLRNENSLKGKLFILLSDRISFLCIHYIKILT